MKDAEWKSRLAEEMSDLAPNRLEELLQACDTRPQQSAPAAPLRPSSRPKRRRWMPAVAAAAVLLLLVGGVWGYCAADASRCIVTVDVNPSVELTVNGFNRVKEARAGNDAAQALLDETPLRGKGLRTAMEALTDALVEHEYLSGVDNAVLVSVSGADAQRADTLCEKTVEAVENAAQQALFHPAVLCQNLLEDAALKAEAQTLQISEGKAAVARVLAAQLEDCTTQLLGGLPVQELLLLAQDCGISFDGARLFGTVSRTGYSDGGAAEKIALKAAGVANADAAALTATPGGYDGQLVYIVRFASGGQSYCYTVAARGGAVLEQSQEAQQQGGGESGAPVQPPQIPEETPEPEVITPWDAVRAALTISGHVLSELQDLDIGLERLDGAPVYRVSYTVAGTRHSFLIHADTDDIF